MIPGPHVNLPNLAIMECGFQRVSVKVHHHPANHHSREKIDKIDNATRPENSLARSIRMNCQTRRLELKILVCQIEIESNSFEDVTFQQFLPSRVEIGFDAQRNEIFLVDV